MHMRTSRTYPRQANNRKIHSVWLARPIDLAVLITKMEINHFRSQYLRNKFESFDHTCTAVVQSCIEYRKSNAFSIGLPSIEPTKCLTSAV